MSNEQAKQLAKDPAYSALKQARTTYLEFNQTKESFKNLKIRQALSYAVDRQELAKKYCWWWFSTKPRDRFSRSSPIQRPRFLHKRPKPQLASAMTRKKPKELLKEGLAELGQDKLSFTLMSSDDDVSKESG